MAIKINYKQIQKSLRSYASSSRKKVNEYFFKTGKGEYGYGDKFLGVTVPDSRKVALEYINIALDKLEKLLKSKIHEERLTALLILGYKFEKAQEKEKNKIYNFYLKNIRYVNNWDLVDTSAPYIVGRYICENNIKEKKLLYKLVKSSNLWERRIAIISTYYFIKQNYFDDTIKIAELLINDNEDLIHKAVGWMLREVGKKNQEIEEKFLREHYKKMPRTMLRYAIERFPEKLRKAYLNSQV